MTLSLRFRTNSYSSLRSVLLRYASPLTVDAMLASACRQLELDPDTIDARGLERMIDRLGSGVRLFCRPEQLPHLMLDLADLAEPSLTAR
jgi:hypothetical protein